MNKWQNRINKFMYGRYGIDDLYKFNFVLYIILLFLNIFLKSRIISTLELIIVLLMFYRCFSKKIYKRSNENQLYLKVKKSLLKPFNNIRRNIKDNDHVYKKCHHCKTILKLPLPYKRGIKHSKCPSCKKRNTFIVLKKQKIEIIRNKK